MCSELIEAQEAPTLLVLYTFSDKYDLEIKPVTGGWLFLFQDQETLCKMILKFCQLEELGFLWCVEVVVREAYMVDATAATRFGRVLHSVKTITFPKVSNY